MSDWRPQHHRKLGQELKALPEVLASTESAGRAIIAIDPKLRPIFTLRHIAAVTRVDYNYLREIVARSGDDPYRVFFIRKTRIGAKANNFRVICVPESDLMRVQRWIAKYILSRGRPHWASHAYAPGSRIRDAANLHCGSNWLIKLDVQRFFESISEIAAYHAFIRLGYQPLIAFEFTRICTRVGRSPYKGRWISHIDGYSVIRNYRHLVMGHLPQGAPTSPMLANLAMVDFDAELAAVAESAGLFYTRYADDITLSTPSKSFDRKRAKEIIDQVYDTMVKFGLSPNRTKTQIVPPGVRKVVLGLLVDGEQPRLTREFRALLRQHLYYLARPDCGPVVHAQRRGFTSVIGLKNHVEGLIRYAFDIDPSFAARCRDLFDRVAWP